MSPFESLATERLVGLDCSFGGRWLRLDQGQCQSKSGQLMMGVLGGKSEAGGNGKILLMILVCFTKKVVKY